MAGDRHPGALVLVVPAVVLPYWLDTRGELQRLTDAELRRGDGTASGL
jgi:cytochrome d ubiquinol oxidase subunit II